MRLMLRENHEKFYFYRRIWEDQKHRHDLNKADLMKILE